REQQMGGGGGGLLICGVGGVPDDWQGESETHLLSTDLSVSLSLSLSLCSLSLCTFLLPPSQKVHDETEFVDQLGCGDVAGVKVLSIFGNTGDGKSHNPQPHPVRRARPCSTPPSRPAPARWGVGRKLTWLYIYLLPPLPGLAAAVWTCPSPSLGPAVSTNALETASQGRAKPTRCSRSGSTIWDLGTEAFSSVQYVGTQTITPPTDYRPLLEAVRQQVKNTHTRSPPFCLVVYHLVSVSVENCPDDKMTPHSFFPDEYFTCSAFCLSCNIRCKNGMNHLRDKGAPHGRWTVPRCYEGGREVIVLPKRRPASTDNPWFGLAKYAWSGFVLECASCGVIYRSRQYWTGNQDPESGVVRSEIKHVWEGSDTFLTNHQNAAQRVLDGDELRDPVRDREYSTGPTKAVAAWVTDQVAPPYWRPNTEITVSTTCEHPVGSTHCRSCGEGFCHPCSSHRMPVPERGWGSGPVRVCKACYQQGGPVDPRGLIARRVTEVAQSTLDMVTTAVDYPLCFVKDVARPDYWVPDQDIAQCHQCSKTFTPAMSKHHCRACGQGVCGPCSTRVKPVPSRGWDHPVRVCDGCHARQDSL
uniref:Si:ch211-11n16.2 n=1 Tax=Cyclopterus lumpus TaxID=8103 RepID=A0A8C2WZG7_CYCLU